MNAAIRFFIDINKHKKHEYRILQRGVRLGADVMPIEKGTEIYDTLFYAYDIPLKIVAMYHNHKKLPFILVELGKGEYILDTPKGLKKEFTRRLTKILSKVGIDAKTTFYSEIVKDSKVCDRVNHVFQQVISYFNASEVIIMAYENGIKQAYGEAMGLLLKEYKSVAKDFSKTMVDFVEPLLNDMEMMTDAFKATGKGDTFKKRHRSLVKAYNEMQRLLSNASKTKL